MHPADLEQLADLIADRLATHLEVFGDSYSCTDVGRDTSPLQPRLLTAAQVAETLGVTRDAVYARADELGAVRIGRGPRPRLRFPLERITAAIELSPGASTTPATRDGSSSDTSPRIPATRRRRPRRDTTDSSLLPIRERGAYGGRDE
jgi:hypothetical protein